jgi:hypothetical protein
MRNYIIISVLVLAIIFLIWKSLNPKEVIKYEKVEVPKEITKIEKVEVPVEKVKVIPKTKVIAKYIPQEVKEDKNKEVLTVGQVKCPDESKITIVAALDKESKETSLYTKIEKKKFNLFPGGEVGFKYGYYINPNIGLGPEITGYIRYDIIQFNDLFVGAGAEIGTDNKAYLYVRYKF